MTVTIDRPIADPVIKINNDRPEEGFCGTAGCLAGHVAMSQGFTQIKLRRPSGQWYSEMVLINPTTGDGLTFEGAEVPGYRRLDDLARDYLGLTTAEADELFDGENTMERLEHLVYQWTNQPERPVEFRQRLAEALDRVQRADKLGLWNQDTWISAPEVLDE